MAVAELVVAGIALWLLTRGREHPDSAPPLPDVIIIPPHVGVGDGQPHLLGEDGGTISWPHTVTWVHGNVGDHLRQWGIIARAPGALQNDSSTPSAIIARINPNDTSASVSSNFAAGAGMPLGTVEISLWWMDVNRAWHQADAQIFTVIESGD
jgi:hypothetical protein